MVELGSAARTASYTGPRPDVAAMVGLDRINILDIGCSTGTLGRSLKTNRPILAVTGVEFNPIAAAEAQKVLDHVVVGDVDDWPAVAAELTASPFDCIICADVLEHTLDPWKSLPQIVKHLTPDGYVVISLPNVGFYDTLLNVFILRRWPRRDSGLHDSTHLRWFARKDVNDLVTKSGLVVSNRRRIYRVVRSPSRVNRLAKYFAIPGVRDLLTYQFVVVARPGRIPIGAG